ncbi:MAG TPA: hypothetical protein VJK09_02470 [Candidatus Paceibacterota bacterium]
MLTLALFFFILALLTSWSAVYVLSLELDTLNSLVPVSAHAHYSLTDTFFEWVENWAMQVQTRVSGIFYKFLYNLLNVFLPWFRKWTRGTEIRLHKFFSLVKGKREISEGTRDNSSQFLKDIRENAEGTGGGKIYEG